MLGWEFPPFISGGLGVHCFELTRALAESGVHIDFFMPQMSHRITALSSGIRIIPVPRSIVSQRVPGPYGMVYVQTAARGTFTDAVYGSDFFGAVYAYNQACVQRVMEEHARSPYDLIHAHDWITSTAALRVKTQSGVPLVATIHSTEQDRTAGLGANTWIEAQESALVRGADAVITVSKRSKALLVQAFGVSPDRVFAIYNGVDARRFSRSLPIFRNPDEHIVLFHGRLSVQKGPLFFIRAAKRVIEHMPNVRFVISGTGDLLPELVSEALQLGITDRITFAGYVPDEFLPALYASADVFVLPSVSEPFGITTLEAMSAGTPAIISRSTGVGEALHYCLSADFWDTEAFANKILGVLSYAPLHNLLREGSRQEASTFTWKLAAEQTIHVYEHALKRRLT